MAIKITYNLKTEELSVQPLIKKMLFDTNFRSNDADFIMRERGKERERERERERENERGKEREREKE